jgi:8-oxo-dGTP pyrophosphatase MutT (NUDIX family)
MTRTPLQAFLFVLVVVHHEGRFLLIQEAEGPNRGKWYLPAGGIQPGESLIEAAIRETREEAGIDITPKALLWMEDEGRVYEKDLWAGRWRFILRAEPDNPGQTPGKTDDALDARWMTFEEIQKLPLRSLEVLSILAEATRGLPELPLDSGYRRPPQ